MAKDCPDQLTWKLSVPGNGRFDAFLLWFTVISAGFACVCMHMFLFFFQKGHGCRHKTQHRCWGRIRSHKAISISTSVLPCEYSEAGWQRDHSMHMSETGSKSLSWWSAMRIKFCTGAGDCWARAPLDVFQSHSKIWKCRLTYKVIALWGP